MKIFIVQATIGKMELYLESFYECYDEESIFPNKMTHDCKWNGNKDSAKRFNYHDAIGIARVIREKSNKRVNAVMVQ